MISKLFAGGITGIGNTVSGLVGKVSDAVSRRRLQKHGSQENREVRDHDLAIQAMKVHMEELKPIGTFVDTVNRLPRPIIVFSIIAFLYIAVFNSKWMIEISFALSQIPQFMWYIVSGVLLSYFGVRTIDKMSDNRKKMSAQQFKELKGALRKEQDKANKSIENDIKENTATLKELVDPDGDGIDNRAVDQLKKFEGWREKPYRCSADKLTIGYGTNIEIGIDKVEGEFLLAHRFKKYILEVQKKLPWVTTIEIPRQYVLYDMAYNMGIDGLMQFKTTLRHVEKKRYRLAARNMLKSKWSKQVGKRANILSEQMKTGEFA